MRRASHFIFAALLAAGCAAGSNDATRPATDVPVEQASDSWWLDQPSAQSVSAADFQRLWDACADTARDYQFPIDRRDFRSGLLTTQPIVSKQFFELWRKDSVSAYDVAQNSLQTIRRTIRFEISRGPDSVFVMHPKVLVERLAVNQRRITNAAEFRYVFTPAPPAAIGPEMTNGTTPIQGRYWYPIARDGDLEQEIALAVKDRLRN